MGYSGMLLLAAMTSDILLRGHQPYLLGRILTIALPWLSVLDAGTICLEGVWMEEPLEWLLGKSPLIKKVIEQIHQVAWSDFSIIIQGETGTGKSYIANLIHNLSTRIKGLYITVDTGG